MSSPVEFEPVGQVTTVFYDDKNHQVFSVRSGGATGVIIKSAVTKTTTTFRIEDKGPIISIKLSPNQKVLSVQRSKNSVEFLNVKASNDLDAASYVQPCKSKTASILGFVWTSNSELVYITDHGVETYSIVPDKKMLKYLRNTSVGIKFFFMCPRSLTLLTSPSDASRNLQVWTLKSGTLYKLPVITTETPVKDKEASVLTVYDQTFISVICRDSAGRVGTIHLYHVLNDQVNLAHVLQVGITGNLGIHILDNLILIHGLSEANTRVYDIGLSGQPHASSCSVRLHNPALDPVSLVEASSRAGLHTSALVPITSPDASSRPAYATSWVIFLPNILVDARYGFMWSVQLKLAHAHSEDLPHLSRIFLNREAGKTPILRLLSNSVLNASVPLSSLSEIFNLINLTYQRHQQTQLAPYSSFKPPTYLPHFPLPPLDPNAFTPQLYNTSPVVVLDQSDIFTNVFSACQTTCSSKQQVIRLQSVLVEYLLSLTQHSLPPRQFLYELLINLCVQTGGFYQLHQILQYHVIADSKPVACLLLSLENAYPGARQLALDMMTRLGTATEEIIEIYLANAQLIPALNLIKSHGLTDTMSARKFLEAASENEDSIVFYNVYKFFEERNVRLRGSPMFSKGERCETFVKKFEELYGDNNSVTT